VVAELRERQLGEDGELAREALGILATLLRARGADDADEGARA
jgi:hypothetical protein